MNDNHYTLTDADREVAAAVRLRKCGGKPKIVHTMRLREETSRRLRKIAAERTEAMIERFVRENS